MKETDVPYFVVKLRNEFSLRQRSNPAFSLRAFSRYLKIQPPTLSAVLRGKRGLSSASANTIMDRLQLSPMERKSFLDSIVKKTDKTKRQRKNNFVSHLLEEEAHYRIIAEWEHYAILSLMDVEDFSSDYDWIARRLGISTQRCELCIANLLQGQLLRRDSNDVLRKAHRFVKTTTGVPSQALRQSHKEALQLASSKIDTTPLELRDFSSMTLALDVALIPKIKGLIKDLHNDVSNLTLRKHKREVYHLGIQFFPLTGLKEKKQ